MRTKKFTQFLRIRTLVKRCPSVYMYVAPLEMSCPIPNYFQVITRLTVDELRAVLPDKILRPRMFLLKQSQVMFITGLGRIDCVEVGCNKLSLVTRNPYLGFLTRSNTNQPVQLQKIARQLKFQII